MEYLDYRKRLKPSSWRAYTFRGYRRVRKEEERYGLYIPLLLNNSTGELVDTSEIDKKIQECIEAILKNHKSERYGLYKFMGGINKNEKRKKN